MTGSSSQTSSRPTPRCTDFHSLPKMAPMKAMKAMKAMKVASGTMTASQAYGSVAETCGLKAKDVKAVIEGIVNVAADQLKKNGSFKLAGALNIRAFVHKESIG